MGDEKLFNNGDIKGTKAKLRTVNGTPIGVCISDPRHPERAQLKTLNVSDEFLKFVWALNVKRISCVALTYT